MRATSLKCLDAALTLVASSHSSDSAMQPEVAGVGAALALLPAGLLQRVQAAVQGVLEKDKGAGVAAVAAPIQARLAKVDVAMDTS